MDRRDLKMVSFLLIISFLLHIIALAAIFQLSKQVRETKQTDSDEIINLFETYLQEIRAENNKLEEELSGLAAKEETKPTRTEQSSQQYENVPQKYEYAPPAVSMEDKAEASLDARILQLHNQGLSSSEIAKKLNCGKTEAELIIKLYGKS